MGNIRYLLNPSTSNSLTAIDYITGAVTINTTSSSINYSFIMFNTDEFGGYYITHYIYAQSSPVINLILPFFDISTFSTIQIINSNQKNYCCLKSNSCIPQSSSLKTYINGLSNYFFCQTSIFSQNSSGGYNFIRIIPALATNTCNLKLN